MDSHIENEQFDIKHEEDHLPVTEIQTKLQDLKCEMNTEGEECDRFFEHISIKHEFESISSIKTKSEVEFTVRSLEEHFEDHIEKAEDCQNNNEHKTFIVSVDETNTAKLCDDLYNSQDMVNISDVCSSLVHKCNNPLKLTQTANLHLKCNSCGKSFPNITNVDVTSEEELFTCHFCSKALPGKHFHNITQNYPIEKRFQCDSCNKCFSRKCDLVLHLLTHNNEKPLACNICNKSFRRRQNLIQHIRFHTKEKPFVCNFCMKCFSLKSHLIDHIRTHTKEKPFQCDSCLKCFSQKSHLVDHKRTHTKEKPFICTFCMKCYSRLSSLNLHMCSHTNAKPYKCNICAKSFAKKSVLATHTRTHTKPFACNICKKSFSQRCSLIEHSHTHSNERPYTCFICTKHFTRKTSLNKHIKRTHANEKPFTCNNCMKTFTRKYNLSRHICSQK